MAARSTTHEVFNQPPPFEDVNLYASDAGLIDAVEREGGGAAAVALGSFGQVAGSAEALGRHLERGLRARRGFEEEIYQSAAAKQVTSLAGLAVVVGGLVRKIEQKIDLCRSEPLDGEEMAMRKVERLDFGSCIGH